MRFSITTLLKFGITNSELHLMQDIAIIIGEGNGKSVLTNASEIVSLVCNYLMYLSHFPKPSCRVAELNRCLKVVFSCSMQN